MLHRIRQIITFQKSNILRITTSDGQYVHVVDGHGQIDGIALARARRHRTLGVVLEPLGQVLGVAAVATRLAPREPLAERPTLPAAAAARLVGLRRRRPAGRGAHVQQANGAARQRFAAVRAGRHLRGEREKYIEYSEIFYICCRGLPCSHWPPSIAAAIPPADKPTHFYSKSYTTGTPIGYAWADCAADQRLCQSAHDAPRGAKCRAVRDSCKDFSEVTVQY